MSRAEVETVVGGPPGDYSGGLSIDGWMNNHGAKYWTATDATLKIHFDDDRVNTVQVYEAAVLPPPTIWEKVRRRLGL